MSQRLLNYIFEDSEKEKKKLLNFYYIMGKESWLGLIN